MDALRHRLSAPKDAASLAAFRVLFGLVMASAAVRYFVNGWIDRFYVRPTFHFHYLGFGWVEPLPAPWIHVVFAVMGVAALMVALGWRYRIAAVVFTALFQYIHLLDVSNYLNHYYLAGLLGLLCCVLPLHAAGSLDARRDPSVRSARLPAWMLYLVRFQIAIVYLFAAVAKLGPDWLFHGQPLGIWLTARTDTPVIGPLLDEPAVALAMSWAGLLYDLTIVFWLSWRKSRPWAYLVVCVFHFFTSVFFEIGVFPLLMTAVATIFFDPSWPRRLLDRIGAPPVDAASNEALAIHRAPVEATPRARPVSRLVVVGLAAWCLFHVAFPLRALAYGGDVLWHEQGMRWSWRVKVREKNGDVTYRVRVDGEARERYVRPSRYLDAEQELEFGGQPDLILQLAHRIRDDLRAEGHDRVEVRADAYASLNGRRAARLVDPAVDLARVDDGLAPASWILPAPEGPPIALTGYRVAGSAP